MYRLLTQRGDGVVQGQLAMPQKSFEEWVRVRVDPLPSGDLKNVLKDRTLTKYPPDAGWDVVDLQRKGLGDSGAGLIAEYLHYNDRVQKLSLVCVCHTTRRFSRVCSLDTSAVWWW